MSKHFSQQFLPAVVMAGAAAIPIVTTAEILHQSLAGAGVGATPAASVAALPRSSTVSSTAGSSRTGTFQGPAVQQPYGTVQSSVTIAGGKISNVAISAPQNGGMSASINQQAIPPLRQETLQAQSANVNVISGATLTSRAYIQSLQGALAQARQGGSAVAAGQSSSALVASGSKLSVHAQGDD